MDVMALSPQKEYMLAAGFPAAIREGERMSGRLATEAAVVINTTAPGYVEPPGPGWWPEREYDYDPDDENVLCECSIGGRVCVYQAAVKLRVRYSVTDTGEVQQHNIPNHV